MPETTSTVDRAFALAFAEALNEHWDAEEFEALFAGEDGVPDPETLMYRCKVTYIRTVLGLKDRLTALDELRCCRHLDELTERYPDVAAAAALRGGDR